MAEELSIGPLNQIPLGEGRVFALGGHRVAVFRNRQGSVFAAQAECPHKSGPLADGLLGGSTLMCPLHDWTFDLATGENLSGGCAIKTYAVRLLPDQTVMVALDGGEPIRDCGDAPNTADISTGAASG